MRQARVVLLALLLFPVLAYAGDPGAAIGQARQAINEHRYDAAVKLLQDAMPDAEKLAEPQHTQALAALHFYSALAYSGANKMTEAKNEIAAFLKYSPQTKAVDPGKYDRKFVAAFNEVLGHPAPPENTSNFDSLYPGFATTMVRDLPPARVGDWGESAELQLLGSADERRQWRALSDDDARRAFIDAFRAKHDPNGELRRRIAFADEHWTDPKTRGSLSDRGRVFVLLGPPRVIGVKPLSAREGASNRIGGANPVPGGYNADPSAASARGLDAADKNMTQLTPDPVVKGSVERWIYGRDQLPPNTPDAEVVFKFMTQEGYGDHVLQREFMVNKVLGDASSMH
jgi:GWxTD domain-containing protein